MIGKGRWKFETIGGYDLDTKAKPRDGLPVLVSDHLQWHQPKVSEFKRGKRRKVSFVGVFRIVRRIGPERVVHRGFDSAIIPRVEDKGIGDRMLQLLFGCDPIARADILPWVEAQWRIHRIDKILRAIARTCLRSRRELDMPAGEYRLRVPKGLRHKFQHESAADFAPAR